MRCVVRKCVSTSQGSSTLNSDRCRGHSSNRGITNIWDEWWNERAWKGKEKVADRGHPERTKTLSATEDY